MCSHNRCQVLCKMRDPRSCMFAQLSALASRLRNPFLFALLSALPRSPCHPSLRQQREEGSGERRARSRRRKTRLRTQADASGPREMQGRESVSYFLRLPFADCLACQQSFPHSVSDRATGRSALGAWDGLESVSTPASCCLPTPRSRSPRIQLKGSRAEAAMKGDRQPVFSLFSPAFRALVLSL